MHTSLDRPTLQHAAEAACRAALRAGLAEPEARDLAQEALVRALSSARPPAGVPLPAWVYGIARNLGRDHAKAARRRELLIDPPGDAAIADDDLATVLAVRRAVHELPEPLREVITLHELEEHSLRETALALGIPFDTAKDRLRRAREQLRARLAETASPSASAVATERTYTGRRAARHATAIVAAATALLGDRAIAAAMTAAASSDAAASPVAAGSATAPVAAGSATAPVAAGFLVRGWIAAVAGGALLVAGFVAGRASAPTSELTSTRAAGEAVTLASPAPALDAAGPPAAIEVGTDTVGVDVAALPSATAEARVDAIPIATGSGRGATQRRSPAAAAIPDESPAAAASGAAERLLLDRARAGIQRGLPDEALVTLMSHARQFPSGTLAEERDVLMIEAYLGAGNDAAAARRIAVYRTDHPAGVLRARVEALAARR